MQRIELSGIVGAATGQEPGQGKTLKATDKAHDQVEENDRRTHRHADMPELVPRIRAVHNRGFVEGARDILQGGEKDHHRVALRPDVDQDQRGFGQGWIGDKRDGLKAPAGQGRVDRAVLGVQQKLPDHRRHHRGYNRWKEEDRAKERSPAHIVIEQGR